MSALYLQNVKFLRFIFLVGVKHAILRVRLMRILKKSSSLYLPCPSALPNICWKWCSVLAKLRPRWAESPVSDLCIGVRRIGADTLIEDMIMSGGCLLQLTPTFTFICKEICCPTDSINPNLCNLFIYLISVLQHDWGAFIKRQAFFAKLGGNSNPFSPLQKSITIGMLWNIKIN